MRFKGSYMYDRQLYSQGTTPFFEQIILLVPVIGEAKRQYAHMIFSFSTFFFIDLTNPFSAEVNSLFDAMTTLCQSGKGCGASHIYLSLDGNHIYLFTRTSASYFLTSESHASLTGTPSLSQ